jgi:DNA-binding MarR family transcriptional regulator
MEHRRRSRKKKAPVGEVVDVAAMRALAHPLRWALMDVLLVEDIATAARCAELLGESQASCSFHLRQLARYGFVEQVESEDRRERPWRMATTEQRWARVQPDGPRARAAAEATRVFVEREMEKFRRWLRTASSYPKDWQLAAGHIGAQSWLTADELADLASQLRQLMTRYKERLDDPGLRPEGSRPVRLFLMSYPLPDDEA